MGYMFVSDKKRNAAILAASIIFIVSVLGIIIWRANIAGAASAVIKLDQAQAYHLARSMAETMADYLIKNPANAAAVIAKTGTNTTVGPLGADEKFRLSVTGTTTSSLAIVSEGRSGHSVETVKIDLFPLTTKEVFPNVIFSKNNLIVPHRVHITGDLESAADISIRKNYTSEFTVTKNSTDSFFSPIIPTDMRLAPNVHVPQALMIQGDLQYNMVSVSQGGTLIFDTQGQVQQVVIRSLDVEGNVFTIGGGRLELYVTDFARFQTPFILNPDNQNLTISDGGISNPSDPNDLFIILADNANLVLRGNAQLNALIYGPNASVQLQSARSTVKGAIIAGNVDLQDGNVIFKPIDYGVASFGIAGFRRK